MTVIQINSMRHMTKKRVMIELDFILLRHIFVLEFLYCIWKRDWILQVNSCVNEDMQDMCFGSQEALFMQVDGGRKKILRIFYALQLFIQLQRWQKKKKYRRLNMKFDAAKGHFKLTIIRGKIFCISRTNSAVPANSSMHRTKRRASYSFRFR